MSTARHHDRQSRDALRVPVLAVLGLLLAFGPAAADDDDEIVSAVEAWHLVDDMGLVIVDVRTRHEWEETGTAPGAERISLYNSWGVPNVTFAEDVLAAVGGDPDRPVALICAAGTRSSFAARYLREHGFSHVADIGEGMTGSEQGMGWLSSALPVADCGACEPTR